MNHMHFKIHKPFGFLSQFKLEKPGKKRLLGELYDFPDGAMSIGRLDEHSEGLLLVTTDGKVSDLVNSSKVEKEYYAQLDGIIDEENLEKLRTGVGISHQSIIYNTKPCKAFRLTTDPGFPPRIRKIRDERHGPTSWVSITLKEGKFRQVRKMTAVIGFPTLRLFRVRIGSVNLENMNAGEVIPIAENELPYHKD